MIRRIIRAHIAFCFKVFRTESPGEGTGQRWYLNYLPTWFQDVPGAHTFNMKHLGVYLTLIHSSGCLVAAAVCHIEFDTGGATLYVGVRHHSR